MINNPEAGIRTNFALDDAVRTSNMNALAQSIQYDYVVTDRMLDEMPEAAVTEYGINVDVLLGGGKITQITTGNVSVLLNIDPQKHRQGQNIPVFYFPCDDVAFSLRVLVYSVHGFKAYIGTPGSSGQTRFYFYTGNNAEVGIAGIGAHAVYVGAFSLVVGSLTLPANARFWYELAKGDLPTPSGSGSVKRTMWMTNADLLPVPDMGNSEYKCFRARVNEMVGEATHLEWVDNLTIEARLDASLIHESLDTLAIQENTQGDWGIKGTGYEYANMPGYRYLVPAATANAFLKADENGKMHWAIMPSPTSEIVYVSTSDTYATVSGYIAAGKEVILKVDVSATLSQYFNLAQKNPDGSYEFACMRPGGTAIAGYSYILATNNNWTRSNIALAPYNGSDTITVDSTNRQISVADASIGYGQLKRNVWRQLYGSASNEGWEDTYDLDRTITGSSSSVDRVLGYVWDYTTKSQLFFTKNAGDDCASQLIHVDFNMMVQPGSSAYAANNTVFKIYLLAQNGGATNVHPISYQERRFEFAPGFSGKHNISGSFTIDTQLLSAFDLTNDPEVCLYFAPWASQWDANVGINITNLVISGFCLGHP